MSIELSPSRTEFIERLFLPPPTADGFVTRRGKWFVDVNFRGRDYRINRHCVWCMRSAPGEPWQHAVLDTGLTMTQMHDAGRSLAMAAEWDERRRETVWRFL